jgi:hypothetical protein
VSVIKEERKKGKLIEKNARKEGKEENVKHREQIKNERANGVDE